MRHLLLPPLTLAAILATTWSTTHLIGAHTLLEHTPVGYHGFLIFCGLWALGGGITSFALSRPMVTWGLKVEEVDAQHPQAREVRELASALGVKAPAAVGVYQSEELNAFVIGVLPSQRLMAISSALTKTSESVRRGTLAHALMHAKRGDTATLIIATGMINAFTLYVARMFALLMGTSLRTSEEETPSEGGEVVLIGLFDLFFTIGASLLVKLYARRSRVATDRAVARTLGADMAEALEAFENAGGKVDRRDRFSLPLRAFGRGSANLAMRPFWSHPGSALRLARLGTRV